MSRVPENLDPIVNIRGTDRYRPPMDEVRGLAWNLGGMVSRSSFEINYLVAVTRGGLTPTDCISRSLGIKDIQALAIEVYEENLEEGKNPQVQGDDTKVYRRPELPKGGEGALFIDDVLDTGKTANYIKREWPNSAIAVVYTKKIHELTMREIDFYGRYVGGVWVDFPWEVENQTREDIRSDKPGVIF